MTEPLPRRPTLAQRLTYHLSRARGVPIEDDLTPYLDVAARARRSDLTHLTDGDIAARAELLRARARDGAPTAAIETDALSLASEAAHRTLGQRPFENQLVAAAVLDRGKVAQMPTGEGKTLAAALGACVRGLAGRGVHVLTANDYLARRDAGWMGPVYRALGLTVASIHETMGIEERRGAYNSDVTYLTAREAGFDHLRDGLRYRAADIVHRTLDFAIVDEADFLLIDEARIPLVIAAGAPAPETDPRRVEAMIGSLVAGRDYGLDRAGRRVYLTAAGHDRVRELLDPDGAVAGDNVALYSAVTVALHAHHLLGRDVDYIVRDGRIELVDELTGRVADRRRWPWGLQPALEAKESLEIQAEGSIHGSVTPQHFFRLYGGLAGLTATAVDAAEELGRWYGLGTVIVPPRLPSARVDAPDRVYHTQAAKWDAVVREIREVHATGRPLLVGTSSVQESETLARRVRGSGIACQVLNARNDHEEAALVARAGVLGALTIATNMAGRGTDIRLGGPEETERARILDLGGLYVLGTCRHESARIDAQLRGRAGRQGDPGLSRFFVSLEDTLVTRYAVTELMPRLEVPAENGRPIEDTRVIREIARAQGIIATQHHDMRRTLRRYTEIVERQRLVVRERRMDALLVGEIPEEVTGADRERLVRCYLAELDAFWSAHLGYVEEVKEGAPLQRLGGEDPLLHFLRHVDDSFTTGLEGVAESTAARYRRGEDSDPGLAGPAGTWTYLVSDDPLPDFRVGMAAAARAGMAAAAALVTVPLALAALVSALVRGATRMVRRKGRVDGVDGVDGGG